MCEIKFRAKIKPGYEGFGYKAGEWFYWTIKDKFTMQEMLDWETLGQYTGFNDRNGKKIYQKDIIENTSGKYQVNFRNGQFGVQRPYGSLWVQLNASDVGGKYKNIGNIYDNPELLKESP